MYTLHSSIPHPISMYATHSHSHFHFTTEMNYTQPASKYKRARSSTLLVEFFVCVPFIIRQTPNINIQYKICYSGSERVQTFNEL